MHPLLASRLRLLLYLAVWVGIGALLGAVLGALHPRPIAQLALFVAPVTLFYALTCLSAWWVCRGNPPATTPPQRLAFVALGAALQASLLWVFVSALWAVLLSHVTRVPLDRGAVFTDAGVLGIAGMGLYAESMVSHYFILAAETARHAERNLLHSQVAAREAELKALRAQLNPHFLFNSLNSISALAGADAENARRMCGLLGDFLRTSLALGARERVELREELTLAERYLAVEQVRFGPRLRFERDLEPGVESCLVPPLLIQPLIENAVKHGVADRVEGGTVKVSARFDRGALEIQVENPRDPEAPARRGQGLGLENVRQRLATLDPRVAHVDVCREPESFRVRLTLPAVLAEGGDPGEP